MCIRDSLLGVPRRGAGADLPRGDHREPARHARQRRHSSGLYGQPVPRRRLPRDHLHDLGDDAKPGGGPDPFGGDLPVPDPRRLQPRDRPARALGEPGGGGRGRRLLGGDPLRRLPARRDRRARSRVLPLGDRLRALRHRGGHSLAPRRMKKHEQLVYSAVGLVALFLILVAVNYLITRVPSRIADLTDGKLYTLSDCTRKVLRELQAPVRLKLYVSQGESVPVPLRGFTQRVEDLVREFKSVAGVNLIVERYNPKPDSEEEDAAQLDGVEPQQLMTGCLLYTS